MVALLVCKSLEQELTKCWSQITGQSTLSTPAKKDPNAVQLTPIEKHVADITGSIRADGSDKFYGFENVRRSGPYPILFNC